MRKEELQYTWVQAELTHIANETPTDVYSLIELREMLDKALSKLPENVRLSFEKNRFDKKKYSEIAEEMNISVKTVESHISKALKLLREELKDYLPLIMIFYEISK